MINPYLIGRIIKRFREANGYSIYEVAKQLGFTPRYIYDIELGNKGMTLDTFEKILNLLKIPANYLLLVEDKTFSEEALIILSLTTNMPEEKISCLIEIMEKIIILP